MLATLLIATASAIGGGVVMGKYVLPKLHKMPPSKVRDALLVALNGGPGSLPR